VNNIDPSDEANAPQWPFIALTTNLEQQREKFGSRGSKKATNPGCRTRPHAARPVIPLAQAWLDYSADAAVSVPNNKKRNKVCADYSESEKARFDRLARWGLRDTPALL
jgi:hypothetical protein